MSVTCVSEVILLCPKVNKRVNKSVEKGAGQWWVICWCYLSEVNLPMLSKSAVTKQKRCHVSVVLFSHTHFSMSASKMACAQETNHHLRSFYFQMSRFKTR